MDLSNIGEALETMVLGMGVVFFSLILLYCILVQFRRVFYKEEPDETQTASQPVKKSTSDDAELIAVVVAAIAEHEGVSEDKVSVTSIRSVDSAQR